TFDVAVNAVNDAPVVAVNAGMSVARGTADTTITTAMLQAIDPDHAASALTFTLMDAPDGGVLKRNGVALGVNDTFTQKDIDDGLVTYTHSGGAGATDTLVVRVADGAAAATANHTFTIGVTASEAPTAISTVRAP